MISRVLLDCFSRSFCYVFVKINMIEYITYKVSEAKSWNKLVFAYYKADREFQVEEYKKIEKQNCFEKRNTGIREAACQHRIERLAEAINILYKTLGITRT